MSKQVYATLSECILTHTSLPFSGWDMLIMKFLQRSRALTMMGIIFLTNMNKRR